MQAYGIKFIITVDGLAQKFSLKNTVLNVGNGLALLGITTVLCEFVLMYFIKVRPDLVSDTDWHLINSRLDNNSPLVIRPLFIGNVLMSTLSSRDMSSQ